MQNKPAQNQIIYKQTIKYNYIYKLIHKIDMILLNNLYFDLPHFKYCLFYP